MILLAALIAAGGVLLALVVLFAVRREHIRVEYSTSWLISAFVFLLIAIQPRFIAGLSRYVSINLAVIFLLLATVVVVGQVFLVSLVVSKLRDENVRLIQRVGILEHQLSKIVVSGSETNQE